jgi:DNA-binding NarL/FixJ family response regulator
MRAHMNSNATSAEVISLDRWAAHRTGRNRAPAIRVLLADGAGLVRAGVRALLEAEPGMTVIAEAASGEEAVAAAMETRPDVVLMDVRLPGLDGLQATRQILASPGLSHVKVLILSEDESDEHLFDAVRAGASGFLVKDTDPVDLSRAVRVLAGGGAQLSPGVTRRLLQEFASQPDPKRPTPELLEELTAREREVMTLVGLGLSNDEIADRLVVSPATAKTHVSRTMVKLHAHDRAKLVVLAYESGLVRPRQHEREPGFVAHDRRHLGQRARRAGEAIASVKAARYYGASSERRVRALQLAGASAGLAHEGE